MPATFKMLASVVAQPNGNDTRIYSPGRGKTAIIGKIIIASTWPEQERLGYHHVMVANKGLVQHQNSNGNYFSGYPQGVDTDENRGYRSKAFIAAKVPPSPGGLCHILVGAHNTASWAGTYSMFKMTASGAHIIRPTLAPITSQILELNHGIPLDSQDNLIVTNGITDLSTNISGDYKANDYTKKYPFDALLQDHRARASHLRVTVFGQEITR